MTSHHNKACNSGVELKLSTATLDKPLSEPGELFDVAIRRGPGYSPNCESGEFLEESELPVCSPALLARLPLLQVGNLAQHTLLHSDTRREAWSKWLIAADVAPASCKKRQSFDHFSLTLQATIDGLGVALGPLPLISDELTICRLLTPIAEPVIRARSYWLIVTLHQALLRMAAAGNKALKDSLLARSHEISSLVAVVGIGVFFGNFFFLTCQFLICHKLY